MSPDLTCSTVMEASGQHETNNILDYDLANVSIKPLPR